LFLLIVPIAFGFSALSAAAIKTKRIVQIVATVMLALATVGVGLIWIMFAVVGADMKEFGLPMIVYYSPWYVIGLWIVNIGVFLIDMFGKNDRDKKRIGRLLFGVVTVAVITTAAVIMIGGGNPQSPSIHDAAGAAGRKGNIEAVKQHFAAGTNVDARDAEDKTPLQHAAYWGHKEIVALLIAKGADVNAKSEGGSTPLHTAALGGEKEIAELLIANGADVNAKNDAGTTPLHNAASGGHKEVVELLIAKGANVNAKGMWGRTPLDAAANKGHKQVAELLIAAGADVNAKKGDDGETPLHHAAFGGYKEIAELLIAKGADVNATADTGATPLGLAYGETFDLLRKHGGKTGEELKAEGK